jgi:hypothetical protein
MSVYAAKVAAFSLCVASKKAGGCHKQLLRFKFVESAVLIALEAALTALALH